MSRLLAITVGLLADDGPRNTGPDFGKASPFGLAVVVLLLIGTFVLVWSMNRHLRKLPRSFDGDGYGDGDGDGNGNGGDATPDGAAGKTPGARRDSNTRPPADEDGRGLG